MNLNHINNLYANGMSSSFLNEEHLKFLEKND
ncbi:hypothetical protein BSPLISOX_1937 [uncultured Gammaproteobacteria bacterium]|jgi:hypothetical protein|nr:hypothetical protein [uncultured Gammaproteobacteria bacterium]CAC9440571.1 hypothetical protein [uncultured Gammaproteobacteria bacterium]VVH65704.1 hypothetical protein BSPLISOX_1937 [uncultured Gammaproteobacteria bacterium]